MKSQDFTYAVSRIRMKEKGLLTEKDIIRLVSQKDYPSVLRTLSELSFGDNHNSIDSIITSETDKLWALMTELTDDISAFDVFRIQNDYHNLKVCVKSVYSDTEPYSMFVSGGTIDADKLYEFIKNREYKELSEDMGVVASASLDALLKTGDGQLCDAIIDKATLEAVKKIGDGTPYDVIKDYAELFIASSDIKIAVRGSMLSKSYEFFTKSLCQCNSLNTETLSKCAVKGFDEICTYLSSTKYKDAIDYIKASMSSFEKYCDNLLINGMKKQKYEPFSIGPLVAYIIAKQNEIKAVRLVLIGKQNGLDDSKISERIRDMYV